MVTSNIDRNTGELTFRNTPDYERPADSGGNNEYLVTVRATDEGNLRGELDVTVTVNDVNEAPEFTSSSISRTSFTYPENSNRARCTHTRPRTLREGQLPGQLAGIDGGDFDISETGVLTFANVPDFEAPVDASQDNEYLVTVQVARRWVQFCLELEVVG